MQKMLNGNYFAPNHIYKKINAVTILVNNSEFEVINYKLNLNN